MKWFDGELTGETISGIHFLLCLNRFQVFIKTLLICTFLFLLLSEEINISVSAAAGEDQNVNQIYFPLILQPDLFDRTGMSIWVDESTYLDFEVALFRKTFTIKQEANDAVLKIFADTRYELYVDGEWFGRGPARFSYSHREYDIYAVDHLSAGEHTIAVLVQWDPNYRRSESIAPILHAHLHGKIDGRSTKLTSTDTTWKAIKSDAWNSNAVWVHSWQLIGHTELVDLRKLPSEWYQSDYDDSLWKPAVGVPHNWMFLQSTVPYTKLNLMASDPDFPLKNVALIDQVSSPIYTARTIPPLIEETIPLLLLEKGQLSPDYQILELPDETLIQSIQFNAVVPTIFSVEILSSTNVLDPRSIVLDGMDLEFSEVSILRPGVVNASRSIASGIHTLTIFDVPSGGLTISLSKKDIIYLDNLQFSQGNHAGRRLLLANPTPSIPENPYVEDNYLPLQFNDLPAYAVVDLGRTIHGRAKLQVDGPIGTVIDLGWDERLFPSTQRPLPFPGSLHPHWNQVDSWILDGNQRDITTIDTRAGRYLLLAVWGSLGPVEVTIHVDEERYPVVQQGFFDSSDDLLNEIWQVGVDTVYPNMTDAYTDTPWRERGQWWGDAYVIDRVNRVAFGDFSLLKRGLLYMGDAFNDGRPQAIAPNGAGAHMSDYGMLWVYSLQEYLQLTNDHNFVRNQYPTVLEFISYLVSLENPKTGLLDFFDDGWGWATTVYIDTFAGYARMGQSVPANAMYIETLMRTAYIAEELGDFRTAGKLRESAEEKKNQLNSNFYLPQQKRYITSFDQETVVPPTVFSQIWPLTYDVVPSEYVNGVFDSAQDLLSTSPESTNIGIYGINWVLDAYGKNGFIVEAIDLIKNYYGWMLSQGATTWWEVFNSIENYKSSLSHGWGSSPTWFLSTYLLGAQQTGPKEWQVKPSFAAVDYVSGGIPLGENELITLQWEKQSCQSRKMFVDAPDDTTGLVILPVFQNATIIFDGKLVWDNYLSHDDRIEIKNSELFFPVSGGDHHFEINSDCK